MSKGDITQKEKVQVLLAEYNTLRAQIISRGENFIQIITIGVASLALVTQSKTSLCVQILLFVFLLGVIAVVAKFLNRDIHEEAAHARKLEAKINIRTGEKLLTWESNHGRAKTGWWHGFLSSKL